ncbi:glycosyltransferase [Limnohabitans sp. 2KL-51]|uniref:glycosyltransferase n=1 Tax=Limnohabitans sp. 2KL-51 TaxID=1977911 RepID=UPI000D39B0A8|nr:glycosyltransferase [Limnohabitans sp. 2KL-51]PUE47640.1 group 1 glycosyl transferase [Limnohabitans sp. 2KL-51]
MTRARVLINCSNLHNGGGVAVATSVLDCLSRKDHGGLELSVLLSSKVARNLLDLGTDLGVFKSCHTRGYAGISALWQELSHEFAGFDIVFTVFGPAYFLRRNTRHLFGFAQPNIVYPNNPLTERMGFLQRWRTKAKYAFQSWFNSRADELVVELEHVKTGLQRHRFFVHKQIHVVYSAVHSVFGEPEHWAPLHLPAHPRRLRLGLISQNYPHKNLAILADVKQHLWVTHRRDVDVFVTFSPDEWAACSQHFRNTIVNVGSLTLSQCPAFYAAMDGVVFPSLLECFSAVPIETMMVGRPLFASNLSFMQDVCGDHCQYFDPHNPADIARVIDSYFRQTKSEKQRMCDEARTHVQRYPSPQQRAENYLGVIRDMLTLQPHG